MTHSTAGEQRRFTRLRLNRPATLTGPYGSVTGRLRDIGVNGVRLDAIGAWAGEENSRYRVHVAIAPGAEVVMDCALVHREGRVAGFRTEQLDPRSLRHLRGLLMLYHGDASVTDAEISQLGPTTVGPGTPPAD